MIFGARGALALTIAAGVVAGAASTVPAFAIAAIAAVLFDRYDPGLTVMQLVFVALTSVCVRLGLSIVARVAGGSAAQLLGRDLRAAAATTIGALPLGELAAIRPAALEAVLLDDVDAVTGFVAERTAEIASASGLLATACIALVARDPAVALVAIAVTAGAMLLASPAGPRARDRDAERTSCEALGAAVFAATRTTELDRSLPDPGAAQLAVAALARTHRFASTRRASSAATQSAMRRAFAGAFPALLVILALGAGGAHAERALLVLFAALGLRMTNAWVVAFGAGAASAPARAARRRIDGLLARPPMRTGSAAFPLGNDVRFREVTFAYPDAPGRDVLRAIDVTARAGTVTAIVGPSGSGKTTFTRLAARFWDVDRGSIEIGGVDVRALPVETLMRGITCVFQDVALLNDTVAANLRLGHPDASDDELVRAARAAGAHDFIAALPLRYNTVIGDRGTLLSRGERQRLQIARAFLKDAPIVILDEPTASMDPATEAGIADALVPLLRGRTVIAVAHRLSTIVDADRIVVLDRSGSVEAQGSHAELLASSPTYAAMWAAYAGPTDRAQRRERVAP